MEAVVCSSPPVSLVDGVLLYEDNAERHKRADRTKFKRRPALNTCTRKLARGGRIPFLHGACVCIWSLYANGAAPVGRCTGRVMGTRFAAHTPREHEHGVCSGRGSKMRLKTNLLLCVSSVLSSRVTVALRFAPAAIHEGVHPVQLALRM